MKKGLFVVLMLCLFVSITVSAVAEKVVYQNGAAPDVVAMMEEQGTQSAAVIKDAQGNIVATIPMDGSVKNVCVSERDEANDEVRALLQESLRTLMADEHVANAPWMLETDLFYTEIPEAYDEYMTEGALFELTFDPIILDADDKLVVLVSTDGKTWTEARDVSFAGNGTVKVGISESCVIAFLVEQHSIYTIYETISETTITPTTVTVTETDSNFTPSVSGKLAPTVVSYVVDGEPCVATITTINGEILDVVANKGWMIVTPLSERVYNPNLVTYEHLQWAYDDICAAENMADLTVVDQDGALSEDIDAVLAAQNSDLTYADLTVSDLFEISLHGEYLEKLKENEENSMEVTFAMGLEKNDTLVVLCAEGIDSWHVVDAENVIINEDGTVTLRMKHVGVVAFLVEKAEQAIDVNAADVVTAP